MADGLRKQAQETTQLVWVGSDQRAVGCFTKIAATLTDFVCNIDLATFILLINGNRLVLSTRLM